MKEKGKIVLIVLALIAFLTVGILLITQIGNIGKIGATVYDANGCPKDGKTWKYDKASGNCTTTVNPTTACESGYTWSSKMQKCYKKATYVSQANTYSCGAGATYIKNTVEGNNLCTKDKVKKCSSGVLTNGKCIITQKAKVATYTITYDGNGGSVTNNGKKANKVKYTVSYGNGYVTRDSIFTRNGYVFVGWNEKKNGTGTDWTSWIGKSWNWTYKKNVTLYAQWKKGTTLITDTNFNKCVIDSYNKETGKKYLYSHVMTVHELNTIMTVDCTNKQNINNITGLEWMKSLKVLSLSLKGTNNKISKIDLSKNTNLIGFSVSGIPFTTLNISKNTKLQSLALFDAKISSLNLSKHTKLTNLSLGSLPNLKSLDLTKNTALKTIIINSSMTNLKTLTMSSKNKSALENVPSNVKVTYK